MYLNFRVCALCLYHIMLEIWYRIQRSKMGGPITHQSAVRFTNIIFDYIDHLSSRSFHSSIFLSQATMLRTSFPPPHFLSGFVYLPNIVHFSEAKGFHYRDWHSVLFDYIQQSEIWTKEIFHFITTQSSLPNKAENRSLEEASSKTFIIAFEIFCFWKTKLTES